MLTNQRDGDPTLIWADQTVPGTQPSVYVSWFNGYALLTHTPALEKAASLHTAAVSHMPYPRSGPWSKQSQLESSLRSNIKEFNRAKARSESPVPGASILPVPLELVWIGFLSLLTQRVDKHILWVWMAMWNTPRVTPKTVSQLKNHTSRESRMLWLRKGNAWNHMKPLQILWKKTRAMMGRRQTKVLMELMRRISRSLNNTTKQMVLNQSPSPLPQAHWINSIPFLIPKQFLILSKLQLRPTSVSNVYNGDNPFPSQLGSIILKIERENINEEFNTRVWS